MKHILLPLSIFLCYQLQAQKIFTVRIEGIHPSVEAQLATGEYLVNAAGVNDGAAPYNLFIDVNSIGATSGKRIFKYVDLKANAERKYPMKVSVDVEKSSKFDATYDLIVLVRIPTTFDNSVWGTAVRKPDQGEIIMTLDRYSRARRARAMHRTNTWWSNSPAPRSMVN